MLERVNRFLAEQTVAEHQDYQDFSDSTLTDFVMVFDIFKRT